MMVPGFDPPRGAGWWREEVAGSNPAPATKYRRTRDSALRLFLWCCDLRVMSPTMSLVRQLTLTGRVLPIGGVKEKVLGAVRAGIHEIIIPAENEAYLDDLVEEVRDMLKIHLVKTLDEVFEIAIVGGKRGGMPKAAAGRPSAAGTPGEIRA